MALIRCGGGSDGYPSTDKYVKFDGGSPRITNGTIESGVAVNLSYDHGASLYANIGNFTSATISGGTNVQQYVQVAGLAGNSFTPITFSDNTAFDISAYDYIFIGSSTTLTGRNVNVTFA